MYLYVKKYSKASNKQFDSLFILKHYVVVFHLIYSWYKDPY